MAEETDFADTLEANLLVEAIAGGTTLVDAAAEIGISVSKVYRRLRVSPRFQEMMDLARDVGFDVIASNVRKVTRGDAGFSSGDVKRDRLIAEYDFKLLQKWNPKKYGEKIEIESKNVNVEIPASDDPVLASQVYKQMIGQA